MKLSKKENTVFFSRDFDILQNIDDRLTLSSQMKRARDPVTLQKPLKEFEMSSDANYEYQVETQDLTEDTKNLPDLWR